MRILITLLTLTGLSLAAAIDGEPLERLKSHLTEYLAAEYESVEQSPLSTGVLYDLVLPMSGLAECDGRAGSPAVSAGRWLQMSHELRRSALRESPIPPHGDLRSEGNRLARDGVHPIAVLDFVYNRTRPDVQAEQALRFDGDNVVALDGSAFETRRVFAASALRDWTYRGSRVHFRIQRDGDYFSNVAPPPRRLEVDFDDGFGYRATHGDVMVSYSETGAKTVRVRAFRDDETPLQASFRFDVRNLDTPDPHETWQVEATIDHDGNLSSGEAYVYLSDQHATLTNPIILAEGIDLDDTRNWDELYDLLNQEGLLEAVREIGFDVVVLNHDRGTDHIQGNAYLLIELIRQVNAVIPDDARIILVGTSMGGLTTRYGLSYMETHELPHNVALWISFDAPHTGANIPLGLQYWVSFFARQSGDAAVMRDALNSPAARQLLVAHFTDPHSWTVEPDPLRADFLSDLTVAGEFPEATRSVAIANGSGIMQGQTFAAGDQLIRWEYSSFVVDIIGNVWALYDLQTRVIFVGEIDQVWPLPDEALTVTVNPTWPWDNAPGGKSNSMEIMDDVDPGFGDIIALHTHHCFIPTISALNLAVANPFFDIDGYSDLYSLTPFDSLYYPSENQSHSLVVPENYGWLMGELLATIPPPSLSVNPVTVDFEQVRVADHEERTLTIANTGLWRLSVTDVDFVDGSVFSLLSPPPLPDTIAASDSRDLVVRFQPDQTISYLDTLIIREESSVLATVPLAGVGVLEELELSTDSLAFSYARVDVPTERGFHVINRGSAPLLVTDVISSDPAFAVSLSPLDELSFTVGPGDSQIVIVSFLPIDEIAYEATLVVFSELSVAQIPVTGHGAAPHIALGFDSLDFGEVVVGASANHGLSIGNTGLWELQIADMNFDAETSFSLVPLPVWPHVVPPLGSREYAVQFSPADTGRHHDFLTIYHDAGDSLVVDLSGVGVQAVMTVRPDTLMFGDVWRDSTAEMSLWILNEGTALLEIDSVHGQDEGFGFVTGSLSIAVDDSAVVVAPFTPADTLDYVGSIIIVSAVGVDNVTASGHGIWTELAVAPDSILISDALPGEEINRSLSVASIGNTSVDGIEAFLTEGTVFGIDDPPPDSLPAYGVHWLTISFLSGVSGSFFDTLVIAYDLGDPLRIPLQSDVVSGTDARDCSVPTEFYLRQNYPNPFNASTALEFGLPYSARVSIRAYDLLGRQVSELIHDSRSPGRYTVSWSCDECATGIYLIVLYADNLQITRKAMLLR